ncbi:MAG: amidohydrolase [Pseudomonadota bacterium]
MTQADLLILNARVLTMDPARPRAEALAVAGGRILAVGERAEIEGLAAPDARRIDAQGASVMPGMTEAHLHLFPGAYGLRLLQLDGVHGANALRDALQGYAAANPDEGLLICKAADYNLMGAGVMTTRRMIDAALPDRPVILVAQDHHTAWANTAALSAAGLLEGRDLPPGSEIVMAEDGLAAGELREHAAYDPIFALRTSGGREGLGLAGATEPEGLTPAQRAEDLETLAEGLRFCASYGFTSLHNMDGNVYQLDLLAELEAQGRLICRTQIPFHLTPDKPLESLDIASDMHARYRTDRLRSGRVKMFMDGVIDSGTGVLVDDYADRAGWRGDPLHDAERFEAICVEADRRGLQISVHAIGDGAVRRTLDGYEAARRANGPRDSRHRVEHIELLNPADRPRFKDLGVVASMQPPHVPGAMDFPGEPWKSRVGEDRWAWAFPIKTLRDDGVPMAFASDWPVSPLDPMRGFKAALTRPSWAEGLPDQRSTLMETVHGYTAGGAYAGFDDHRLGRLSPGLLADIVVMDRDLEATPPQDIDQARAAITLVDGEIVWES